MKFEIGSGDKKKVYEYTDTATSQRRANKFYDWFTTLKGQKFVGSMWIGLSAVGALYHIAPHWFFLNQVKSVYQSYSKGFKAPIQNELLTLLNDVVKEMNLNDEEVERLKVFITTLSEPYGWGELGKDALVGFPDYFQYEGVGDVPMDKIRIGTAASGSDNLFLTGGQIESEAGKQFASSLVLSSDAKKFAIARELERTRQLPFMTHGVISFCFILLTYNFARIMNKKLGLMGKPPLFRGMLYLGLLPTMMMSYFLTKDMYNRYLEREIDRRAALVTPGYSAGGDYTNYHDIIIAAGISFNTSIFAGVEYYTKILQRNAAMREFQGEAGAARYTRHGDIVQGLLRSKVVSISDRRDICASQTVN